MTTLEDVRAYQSVMDDLTTVAVGQVNRLLVEIADPNPVVVRDLLVELLPGLVEPYVVAAGDLAATWYEDLRGRVEDSFFQAGVFGALVEPERVAAIARWSVTPLFDRSVESTVLTRAAGSVQRLVAGAGRETVRRNAARDRVRVGYARVPRPGCCAFCSMTASRGAVYGSEQSAGGVGNTFHDSCRCVVAPVFRGDTFARDVSAEHRAIYQQSIAFRDDRAIDVQQTLANMRAIAGSR